jgi:glycerol transport system ATP-binding protein
MARIELVDVWHSYEQAAGDAKSENYAVKEINVVWEDGSANALLGPSGCGKTTLLQIVSGLLQPTRGKVLVDGEDMTALRAKDRHIAQVFQFPVVYDSMNVYGNLAFPLVNDGVSSDRVKKRVHEVAELLEIEHLLNHGVTRLTPADKQRVSLGRGIVREDTGAVLLDEPLTVIDPKAQWSLRRKLKQVQQELDFTMIYVTHDQHEALTFAENVTVMQVGNIEQVGSPQELHEYPASTFIGYFIGSPGMNIVPCNVAEDGAVSMNDVSVSIPVQRASEVRAHGENVALGIRPEYVQVSRTAESDGWFAGRLTLVEDNGAYKVITTRIGDVAVKARAPEEWELIEGDTVYFRLPAEKLAFFKDERKIA